MPALRFSGLNFFTGTNWNFGSPYGAPVTSDGVLHNSGESFGALPEILGTLATSAIALIIAVPVSIGAALVIVERLPRRLANVVGLFLELLAGVPSVIVGPVGRAHLRPDHRARHRAGHLQPCAELAAVPLAATPATARAC